MRTKLKIIALLCLVVLFRDGNSQGKRIPAHQPGGQVNKLVKSEKGSPKHDHSCAEIEFRNTVLQMEVEMSEEAYNDLYRELEKLKSEVVMYQQVVQHYSITSCAKTMAGDPNGKGACGSSYLESITPCSVSESPSITYFVSAEFREASIRISGDSLTGLLEFQVKESGYGQYSLHSGDLKAGVYNCCLHIDGRELDCRKLIVMQ